MAITKIEYTLFRLLRERAAVPLGADILELGEANWYGDVPLDTLAGDIDRFAPQAQRGPLRAELEAIVAARSHTALFDIAKIWWRTFLQPGSLTAIDFHGTGNALELDLNYPIDLPRQYGVIANLGTAEHVFNVGQVFKTIHDYTLPGGLMIHGLPLSGWVDHGFYSFNSTLYWDLAAANRYTVMVCLYTELNPEKLVQLESRESVLELAKSDRIGKNSLIYTVMRKPPEGRPFAIPMQGYYAGSISEAATKAWTSLR